MITSVVVLLKSCASSSLKPIKTEYFSNVFCSPLVRFSKMNHYRFIKCINHTLPNCKNKQVLCEIKEKL